MMPGVPNPKKGRLDLAMLEFGKIISERVRQKTGLDIWDEGGLRELTHEFIRHWGIPSEPINLPILLARASGLLPTKSRLRRVV